MTSSNEVQTGSKFDRGGVEVALIRIRDRAHAARAVSSDHDWSHWEGCWIRHRDCFACEVAEIAEEALDGMGVPR